MSGDTYYLLSFLKGLDSLGDAPPLTLSEFRELVSDCGGNTAVMDALFLGDDLLQRQAFLSGETEQLDPAVLTLSQVRDEEPLPGFLAPMVDESAPASVSVDAVWESYYRHVAAVADARPGSAFLKAWIGFEVGLRNALVLARAKALKIDTYGYLVAPELGDEEDNFDSLINEWTLASDPFAGLRVLDTARWQWITENEGWFTFTDDELAAYGAKLMLLKRWRRLDTEASGSGVSG